MVRTDRSKGRQGGRKARQALRSAPLSADMRPVVPGLEGGRYRPLTDADVRRIHSAALDVLETIGMDLVPPIVQERALELGCHLNAAGRLVMICSGRVMRSK